LVQDDQVCLLVKRTSNSNSLALSTGDHDSSFADHSLVTTWPPFYRFGDLCRGGGLPQPVNADTIRLRAKCNVFRNACVGKKNRLRDMSYMLSPCRLISFIDQYAVHFQCPLCRLQQTHQDV